MKRLFYSILILLMIPSLLMAQGLSLKSINDNLTTNYSTTIVTQAWIASQGYLQAADLTAYRLVADSYSTSEVDTLLNAKLNADVINGYYTAVTTDMFLSLKANAADVYTTAQVDILLNAKLDASAISAYYTILQVDALLFDKASTASVALKANSSDVYTKGEADALLLDKADTSTVALKIARTDTFTTTLSGTVPAPTAVAGKVLADDGSWKTLAAVGGGATNATDLTTNTSAITEALNQQGYNDSLETNIIQSYVYGFEETGKPTLSYDSTTRTLSIGAAYVWCNGKRYHHDATTITHPATVGIHYFYYDSAGTLTQSQTQWDIVVTAQIAYVQYSPNNFGTPKGILFSELHGRVMDGRTHKNLHMTKGAQSLDLFPIADYLLQPASPTTAGNQFSISGGTIYDEDISHTIAAWSDGTCPSILWRVGANGDWNWLIDSQTPFLVGTTYPKYNQFTGGAWTTTEVAVNTYLNMWLCVTPATNVPAYVLIMGQNSYATLALAQAATFSTLNLGNLPFNEFVPVQQITFRTGNAYTSATGRARIESVTSLYGTRVALGTVTATNHNSLSGRDIYLTHPSTSIGVNGTTEATLFPSGTTTATAQDAFDTITVNFPTATAMNAAIAAATSETQAKTWYPLNMAYNDYTGEVIVDGMAASATVGQCLYLASGGWTIAKADSATTIPAKGLCVEIGTGNRKVLLRGIVRNSGWSFTKGQKIYVSAATAGAITSTAPSTTGNQIQIIGIALSTDTVYFYFDGTYVEI